MEVDGVQAGVGSAHSNPNKCYVIAHSIAKKHNLGTLARSASAFNVAQICVVGHRQLNTFGSHGADAYVPMKHLNSLTEVRSYLKDQGCEIIGVEIVDGAKPITEHPFKGPTAFILGNEGTGMSKQQVEICDSFVYIPQFGSGTASLNVTVAASIVLHHFATWAGYSEAKRVGEKFEVGERPQRKGPRDEVAKDPEEVVEERRRQKEESALREEWVEKFSVNLFDDDNEASGNASTSKLSSVQTQTDE
mmetsp:Transcript_30733/g.67108  ORF Transcript_30733/g.67108 Transcript_30733/m.67108 type:complete len:248 (-) Transcript_30733:191-934(-)|eukprot:CAMPEP_0118929080 /NCGR_PEP_ID=MMETSP1169-20130426/6181_1 /TAXON_ID=36882 /ORGANISM="Pyramimonas obovata, Strain CCMP722" /LENGTH=247 /DNA_ID=CAMNT_0006871203 /DNA_START=188 /DNA_END=931 /DNA_ORIENTATION=-